MSFILAGFPGIYEVDTNGCWVCIGKLRKGRPYVMVAGRGMLLARLLCLEKYGPPPDPSMHACHSCFKRSCINPDHIGWGDAKENMTNGWYKPNRVTDLPRNIYPSNGAGYRIYVDVNGVTVRKWSRTLEEAIIIRNQLLGQRHGS